MKDYSKMEPFWFYKTYLTWLENVLLSSRYKLLLKIIEYGTERVEDLTDIIDPSARGVFPQIKYSIDASKKRHDKAVENGKKGGRPRKIWSQEFIGEFQYMIDQGYSIKQIAEHFKISLSTAYRCKKIYPIPTEILTRKAQRKKYRIGEHLISEFGFELTCELKFGEPIPENYYKNRPVPVEELARRYKERLELGLPKSFYERYRKLED